MFSNTNVDGKTIRDIRSWTLNMLNIFKKQFSSLTTQIALSLRFFMISLVSLIFGLELEDDVLVKAESDVSTIFLSWSVVVWCRGHLFSWGGGWGGWGEGASWMLGAEWWWSNTAELELWVLEVARAGRKCFSSKWKQKFWYFGCNMRRWESQHFITSCRRLVSRELVVMMMRTVGRLD